MKRRKRINLGPILITPGFIFIFMFLIFPVAYGLTMSMFRMSFLTIQSFAGFQNFHRIFARQETVDAIFRGLYISLISVSITMVIGFVLAYWIDSRSGGYAYMLQIVGLIPWVLSMVVGALLWKWIFAGELGLINYVRSLIGLPTTEPLMGKFSAKAVLVFVISWRTIGYSMVMLLAGLKMVPTELIEVASVDGAGTLLRIRHIILPLIKTPLLISGITVTLSNINNVTVPMVLTGGGPVNATNVVSLELYRMAFAYSQYDMASALAMVVLLINIIMIAIYMRAVKWHM